MNISTDKPLPFPLEFFQTLGDHMGRSDGGGRMASFRICDILHPKEYGNVSSSQVSPSESSDGEQAKSKKARRARTVFTEKQLHELETTFQRHKYLSVQERQLLAHRMALSDIQVKTWYQNRRTKLKKEQFEQQYWSYPPPPPPLWMMLQQTLPPLPPLPPR